MKIKLPTISLGRKKTLSNVYWQKNCQGYINLLKDTDNYPSPYTKVMIPTLIDLAKKYATSQSTIIDIGCGEGFFTRKVKSLGMNISGIDLSKEMITEAKAKDSSIHYQVKDIEQKSSTNIKFDLVFSNLVFHYIEGINIALQNIHHLLKKNGYFIVTIPHPCFYLPENFNWFQDVTDTKFFMGNYFSEKTSVRNIANSFRTHHIHRTIGSYIRIFTKNHFKIVDLLEPSSKLTKPIGLKKNSQIPFFAIFVIQKCS